MHIISIKCSSPSLHPLFRTDLGSTKDGNDDTDFWNYVLTYAYVSLGEVICPSIVARNRFESVHASARTLQPAKLDEDVEN